MKSSYLTAEIIAVGSELLDSPRTETNSIFLADELNRVGARVARKWVVADEESIIREALEGALGRSSDLILFSGGLGPTTDDITREVVSATLRRPLAEDPAVVDHLHEMYGRFGVKMTENNRRQAGVPAGASVLHNPRGTAPGLLLEEDRSLIFLLPGPPRELKPMVRETVLPLIREKRPSPPRLSRILKVAAVGESKVDHQVQPIYSGYSDIDTTILSSIGIIDLRFYWNGNPEDEKAEALLDELAGKARAVLAESVYSERDLPLEVVVGELLRSRNRTLSTAESCTGGLLAKMLTDCPGSSAFFPGGVVAYSNELKTSLLGVNETTLQRRGAVSRETAMQMADGLRNRTGTDYALALTGIAGPDGGTPEKPVGRVYVALSQPSRTQARRLQLPGGRNAVRLRSARLALDWLRRELL